MSKLSEKDAKLFFILYPTLLFYSNNRHNILPQLSNPAELMSYPAQERIRVRNRLFEDIGIIDSFIQDNPAGFSSHDLEIVASWKHFIQDSFYLFRYLKNYSIFLRASPPTLAYGVLALSESLEDMFPSVPVLVKGVLLPFKGRIIYDGYLSSYSMIFGSGIRRSINTTYKEAKATYGIITSLPFEPSRNEAEDAEKLKFYLKSERNRDFYWEEIEDILEDNPELMVLYHQETGKRHARTYGKRLRDIGLEEGWFGILKGLIVASGKNKAELERNIQAVVPSYMHDYVYQYRLKSKK